MYSTLQKWRDVESNDDILKKDLQKQDKYLENIFDDKMTFGTAGIRGIMGAGTNKINEFTIATAADSYAKFLIKNVKDSKTKGIIIGHDNRHNSKLFSEITAKVIMQNGIKAFLYNNNEMQPTPLVSYTIRKLKLAGGVVITASHNPKEYNGFKVYNSFGAQLMPNNTNKIQKIMQEIDCLNVKQSTKKIKYIDNSIIESYISDVIKSIRIMPKIKSDIKIAFSPLHGTSTKIIPEVLNRMNFENYIVEKQAIEDGDFKHTKSSNPEESKAYNKVISLARKKNADLAIITDPDADRIGVAVKYKKRYKYLNGNQLAALYLNFKLSKLKKEGKLPKDGYIVKTNVSGNLTAKIAKNFGLKVYETHVGFKNIASLIKETKGTFILGYEESYGMVMDASLVRDKDAIQAVVGISEMATYFKSQNTDSFSELKKLYAYFGIHRTTQISKKLDEQMTNRLLKRMSKIKKINGHKITKIEDYRTTNINGLEKTNLVKAVLKNGSWFAIRPSGTEPKVKIYVQSVGDKKQTLMDVVIFEREIANFIEDNTEVFEDKKWSWKVFLKYIIFLSLIMGIMTFVFMKVYPKGAENTINDAWDLLRNNSRIVWMSLWIFTAFNIFLNGWMRKRLIDFQGEKVKTRHIIISSLMSTVVSFVTPFMIGGDAIGYWYLRRKGFKRGPLLSSFITSTIIYQIGLVLQTLILVAMGIPVYKLIFFGADPESKAAFGLFVIGITWDVFATIMILSLALNKKFQEGIVRKSIKLLEWFKYVNISDPGAVSSGYQYEFKEMRSGMQRIWTKKMLLCEILFYELLPKFLSGGALIFSIQGIIKPNLERGTYWTQIITGDIIRTANSMSITPGGSGTDEWLNLVINEHIYNNGKSTAAAVDLLTKIISWWPQLLLSTMITLVILIGEKRSVIHNKNNKNSILREEKNHHKRSTRVYSISSVAITLIMVSIFILFMVF